MFDNYDSRDRPVCDRPVCEKKDYKSRKVAGGQLCHSYKELIRKSIAYHAGRYIPNLDENGNREKLIPKEYIEYLKKLI